MSYASILKGFIILEGGQGYLQGVKTLTRLCANCCGCTLSVGAPTDVLRCGMVPSVIAIQ